MTQQRKASDDVSDAPFDIRIFQMSDASSDALHRILHLVYFTQQAPDEFDSGARPTPKRYGPYQSPLLQYKMFSSFMEKVAGTKDSAAETSKTPYLNIDLYMIWPLIAIKSCSVLEYKCPSF